MLTKKEDELRSVLIRSKKKEEKKIQKKTDKMIKREKKRERKALKLLRAELPKPPLITPHMPRFLDDLPIPKTFDGHVPAIDDEPMDPPESRLEEKLKSKAKRVASPKKSPAKRGPVMAPVMAPADGENPNDRASIDISFIRSSPIKRMAIRPPSYQDNQEIYSRHDYSFESHESVHPAFFSSLVVPLPAFRHQSKAVAIRIEPEEKVERYDKDARNYRHEKLVVVVPSNHASNFDGKDPLFTSPKNVLYC